MANKHQRASLLSAYIRNYMPKGWKESIGKVAHTRSLEWYEVEAIESFFADGDRDNVNRIAGFIEEISDTSKDMIGKYPQASLPWHRCKTMIETCEKIQKFIDGLEG